MTQPIAQAPMPQAQIINPMRYETNYNSISFGTASASVSLAGAVLYAEGVSH